MLERKVKGLGQPILYLDFDGVLHPEHCYWHPRKGPYPLYGWEVFTSFQFSLRRSATWMH